MRLHHKKEILSVIILALYYFMESQMDLLMSPYIHWTSKDQFLFVWNFYLWTGDAYNIIRLFLLFCPLILELIWLIPNVHERRKKKDE